MRRALSVLIALLGAVSLPAAAGAQALILRSTAPAYPPGRRIGDNDEVRLGPSQRLLVLRGGATRIYCGPAAFRLRSSAGRAGCSQVARLYRPRLAGVHQQEPPGGRPIPLDRGGTLCLVGDANAHFPLPAAAPAAPTATLNGTPLFWADSARAAWPNAVPREAGARYRLRYEAGGRTVETIIVRVADGPADRIADEFVRNGCTAQLAELSNRVPASGFTWEEVETNFVNSNHPPAPSPELFGIARGGDVRANPNLECAADEEQRAIFCTIRAAKLWDWFPAQMAIVAADPAGRPRSVSLPILNEFHRDMLSILENRYGEQPATGWRFADGSTLALEVANRNPMTGEVQSMLSLEFGGPGEQG